MPRSKLGLKLPVEQILQRKKCNPVALLADMVMERDDKGWVLQGRDRLMALCRLMDHHKPKPKPHETVSDENRNITITRQTYTLGTDGPPETLPTNDEGHASI